MSRRVGTIWCPPHHPDAGAQHNRRHNLAMYDGALRVLFSGIQRDNGEYRDEDTNTLLEGQTNGESLDAVAEHGFDLVACGCTFHQGAPNGGSGMDGRIETGPYHQGGAMLDPVKAALFFDGLAIACAARDIAPIIWQFLNEEYKLGFDNFPAYVECVEAAQAAVSARFPNATWYAGSNRGEPTRNGKPTLAYWLKSEGHLDRLNLTADVHFNGDSIDSIEDQANDLNAAGIPWGCLEDRQPSEGHNNAIARANAVFNKGGEHYFIMGQRNENWHDENAPCVWGVNPPRPDRQHVGIFSCSHSVNETNWEQYKVAVNAHSSIGKRPGQELPMEPETEPPANDAGFHQFCAMLAFFAVDVLGHGGPVHEVLNACKEHEDIQRHYGVWLERIGQ